MVGLGAVGLLSGKECDKAVKQVPVEMMDHLIFHSLKGFEGWQFFLVGPGGGESIVYIGNAAYSAI